jgi:hypothetical protein
VTCPGGQAVAVLGRERPYRSCVFDQATCRQCPLQARCSGTLSCHDTKRTMWLPLRTIHNALRRQRSQTVQGPGRNRRAAVEALMRCLKHPFGGRRGKIRVTMLMVAGALMVNLRRIWRYGAAQSAVV